MKVSNGHHTHQFGVFWSSMNVAIILDHLDVNIMNGMKFTYS